MIIEYLGVQVTFFLEDSKQVALLYCEFGHARRFGVDMEKSSRNSSPPPESEPSANSRAAAGGSCSWCCKRNKGCN